jgi:photosystem II stability/assembly factor-like uncharacterized protein
VRAILLIPLLCAAPAEDRLFAELDVGLEGRPATAVAISPANDKVVMAAVDGLLFRSRDAGENWAVVLRTSAQTVLPVEDELDEEDAASEAAEEMVEGPVAEEAGEATAEEFAPDLEEVDVERAIEDLEEDLQETLAMEREGGAEAVLPEGDIDIGTDVKVPRPQELPGIRRVLFRDADVVYAATHRGLYRSTDGGESFIALPLPRNPRLQDVRDVCAHPDHPRLVMVATAGGALWSTDSGRTWTTVTGPAARAPSMACAVGGGPTPVLAVATKFGLARSVDWGQSYDVVVLPGTTRKDAVLGVAVDDLGKRIYVSTARLLFAGPPSARILSPVGAAWRDGLVALRVDPLRGSHLWVAGRRGVFRSRDGGRSAVEVGAQSMMRDVVDVAVGHQDPDWVVAATTVGVFGFKRGAAERQEPTAYSLFSALTAREPTAVEVATWAAEAHRLDPGHAVSMRTRANWAGLGPKVVVSAGPPPLPWVGPFQPQQDYLVEGTATWNPAKLFSGSQETLTLREHRRLLSERERVWARVLKKFEARRRLQADMLVHGQKALSAPMGKPTSRASAVAQARKRLRLQELTASLDAYTEGRFSREARVRGAPADGISIKLPAATPPAGTGHPPGAGGGPGHAAGLP